MPAKSSEASGRPGRRERVRRETLREIKAAALEEVREVGAAGLSLRSVARRVGMSPAGLYRYVASREDLLTLLITEGYADLGFHVQAAIGIDVTDDPMWDRPAPNPAVVAGPGSDVTDRLRAVALAYRDWSVAHPNEFGLLFGDPIPGYVAPPAGPTVEGMRVFASGLAQPLLEAWHEGRIRRLPDIDAHLTDRLSPMAEVAGEVPPEVFTLLLLVWGRMHGQISLEVFGHHAWILPDGCAALYAADIDLLLRDLGVVETAEAAG